MNYWFLYTTSTGDIYGSPYLGYADEWTNIPSGCAVLGPIADTDTTAQDAWSHPSYYQVQNGALVKTVTDAQLIQDASKSQQSLITAGLNATLSSGFTSKTTGHTYVTTLGGQSNLHGELTRFQLDSSLASVQFFTMDAGWIAHTQAEIRGAFLDGGLWKDAQYAKAQQLTQQIQTLASQSGTTIAQIQAVVWTEASY